MKEIVEQIKSAYHLMRAKAKYLPSSSPANLFAPNWWKQEDDCVYHIGCPDFENRRAMIFAIEAAHVMCGVVGNEATAIKLLEMAAEEMRAVVAQRSLERQREINILREAGVL